MNVQEDDTPSGLPPHDPDRDVLAERRARRGEAVGDPILIRRAETAEAAAQALEARLAGIQARLGEAEQESQAASERLAERERELARASGRLTDGERQLHSISARLSEREQELHSVSQRLGERERELRVVSERLAERERQLHRAELEIRGRLEALELRVGEVQEELLRERAARQAAEIELAGLRAAQTTMQPLVAELKQIAQRLRLAAEASSPPPAPPAPQPEPPDNAQMAEALAAAVQRLRARVAAVGEDEEEQPRDVQPESERAQEQQGAERGAEEAAQLQQGAELAAQLQQGAAERGAEEATQPPPEPAQPASYGVPHAPLPAGGRPQPRAWLAPAIRRVAQRRDPRLAAELVLELLPAQALAVDGALRYVAKIAELGSYEVSLADGRGFVRELAGGIQADSPEFWLEGSAAAFAEVAAGGSRLSSWRPPAGLRVRGSRRRAKRLLHARQTPLVLADLEPAGVTVWPGLLLLALAEAIDPASTAGETFTIAFAIEGEQSAVLQVRAQAGRPLAVSRAPAQAAPQVASAALAEGAQTTVRLSERAFARMLSGQELGGETIVLEGDPAPLESLLAWTDRVQGIRRLGA